MSPRSQILTNMFPATSLLFITCFDTTLPEPIEGPTSHQILQEATIINAGLNMFCFFSNVCSFSLIITNARPDRSHSCFNMGPLMTIDNSGRWIMFIVSVLHGFNFLLLWQGFFFSSYLLDILQRNFRLSSFLPRRVTWTHLWRVLSADIMKVWPTRNIWQVGHASRKTKRWELSYLECHDQVVKTSERVFSESQRLVHRAKCGFFPKLNKKLLRQISRLAVQQHVQLISDTSPGARWPRFLLPGWGPSPAKRGLVVTAAAWASVPSRSFYLFLSLQYLILGQRWPPRRCFPPRPATVQWHGRCPDLSLEVWKRAF